MRGLAQIEFLCSSLSSEFVNGYWKDFWVWLEAILGSSWPSEATSKASVINYANEEGPGQINNPPKIFNLEPQCERETGRASQADDTPNGVGGYFSGLS